jgi:uncharacterized repeat protein (TIGR02543 family)
MKRIFFLLFFAMIFLGGCEEQNDDLVFEERKAVTVTFYSDGEVFETETLIERENLLIESVSTPQLEGYTFGGWLDEEGNIKTGDFLVKEDRVFTADFTPKTYTVSSVRGSETIEELDVQYGGVVILEPPQLAETEIFEGWYEDSETTILAENFTITEDETFYAKVVNKTFDVSFVTMVGGLTFETLEIPFEGEIPDVPTPARTGYIFSGWYTDEFHFEAFDYETMPANNLTLYAKWEKGEYEVTLVDETLEENLVFVGEYNDDIPYPENLFKEGYTFDGWYEDVERTQKFERETFPETDKTLYGKWEPIEYKITLTFETETIDHIYIYEETLEIPDYSERKEGQIITGWYLNQELTDPAPTEMPPYDITLYPKWEIE